MKETIIHHIPKLGDAPCMIAALPDMGNVAGIGMNFLIKKLNAKVFAEINAYWPPYVTYNNGIIHYDQTSYKFYYIPSKNIVIFTGDFNPSDPIRLHQITNEVVKMAEKLNINRIYSMGAALKQNMATASSSSSSLNSIYVITNNPDILKIIDQHDNLVALAGEGQVVGFNGLILGLAKNRGIDALCLLTEIDNPNIIQPRAAQIILSSLVEILKIKLTDMTELEEEEKRKNFMQQQISYFEKTTQEGKSPGIA